MLCAHDKFLEDTELSGRTQSLPPGVLSVVIDACHSGGLDKVFFPDGGVEVARVKVFQPDAEQRARDTANLMRADQLKAFGREPVAGDRAAKAWLTADGALGKAAAPAVELNGVLFAACQATQTAAAGTRRSVRLDALLRRCAVTAGRLAEPGTAAARLEVTFAPDPRLWPADLLPVQESAS